MSEEDKIANLGYKLIQRVQKFYARKPVEEYPFTVLGQNARGALTTLKLPWDSNDRSASYAFARYALREASLHRYVVGCEGWLHHPEGDREALVIAGADLLGNRWSNNHMIFRYSDKVQLESVEVLTGVKCTGDIYTLLKPSIRIITQFV